MSKNSESSVNQVPRLEKGLKNSEAGEMAQWLRTSTALSEDAGSVSSAHTGQFTVTPAPWTLVGIVFWPPQAPVQTTWHSFT